MSYNLGRIDPDQRRGRYAGERSKRNERYADEDEEEPLPRPRRVLAAVAALIVMGVFAGGLWLAYVEGLRHSSAAGNASDIPLIRADTRPMKVKPANPGGMAIPDRDMLIYGEGRPTVEHLLAPPEQPMARPAPPPAPASPPTQAMTSPPTPGTAGAAPAQTTPVEARPNSAAAGSTTPVRPEEPEAAVRRAAAVSAASPRRTAREPASAETAPAKTGGVRLQLGSVRSEGIARVEWDRISRDDRDLLGRLSAIAVRTDLGGKGVYYRIETAPVADMARAERICQKLRQRHLGCIVVR